MKFGLAVFPSKEVQDYANSFRKRYDPHYALIQPHMTLREEEEWNEDRLEQAIVHLEKVTESISPFTIEFNRFSNFYPSSHVIYMALADPKPFFDCYDQICQGMLLENHKHYPFNPHLTIGRQLSSDELHDVFSSLKNIRLSYKVTVDRVHLLYQTENGAWTAHQTFLLKRKTG